MFYQNTSQEQKYKCTVTNHMLQNYSTPREKPNKLFSADILEK